MLVLGPPRRTLVLAVWLATQPEHAGGDSLRLVSLLALSGDRTPYLRLVVIEYRPYEPAVRPAASLTRVG